ncbi:MAG: hypothetical protein ACK5DD_13005 [Cyclobacteriaceae bacterium]|jgi:hypothetical protein
MNLDEKVNQLTDLMADLIPAVDRLTKVVSETQRSQEKTNLEFQELRLSNIKLADAIDKLSSKLDTLGDLEMRISRLEKMVIK